MILRNYSEIKIYYRDNGVLVNSVPELINLENFPTWKCWGFRTHGLMVSDKTDYHWSNKTVAYTFDANWKEITVNSPEVLNNSDFWKLLQSVNYCFNLIIRNRHVISWS